MRHKLQFLVNDHVIPYNMTVYQAIRQFAMAPAGAGGVLPGGGLQVSEFAFLLLCSFLLFHHSSVTQTISVWFLPLPTDVLFFFSFFSFVLSFTS